MKAMTVPPLDKLVHETVEFGQGFTEALRTEVLRRVWQAFEYLNVPTPASFECLRDQIARLRTAIGDPQSFLVAPAPSAVPSAPVEAPVPELISPRAEIIEEVLAPVSPANGAPEVVEDLEPLPGYHVWNAKTAAAAMSSLDPATLQAVRTYEEAHGNRVTVLRAIEKALEEPRN